MTMTRWAETHRIARRVLRRARGGEPSLLATVVGTAGSSYRAPGAKLLLDGRGGIVCGGVSAGCIEQDVALRGVDALASRLPALVQYDVDTAGVDDPMGWGVGCGGSIEIFIQPLDSDGALRSFRRLAAALARGRATALTTVLEGERPGRIDVQPPGPEDGPLPGRRRRNDETVFTEVLLPPPRLLVFGGGAGAVPVVRLAAAAGFRPTVVDHRPALVEGARYAGAAGAVLRRPEQGLDPEPALAPGQKLFVLLMTHDLGIDLGWLEWALAHGAAYVGVLGSRTRMAEVRRRGGMHAAVFGPVGLDIGAEGAEQIAVSVVAEMLAVHAGRRPGHLRQGVP